LLLMTIHRCDIFHTTTDGRMYWTKLKAKVIGYCSRIDEMNVSLSEEDDVPFDQS
jgi:hypothetical protein